MHDTRVRCVISEFKGHPILEIDDGGLYPFTLGLRKARAVLAVQRELSAFVRERDAAVDDRSDAGLLGV